MGIEMKTPYKNERPGNKPGLFTHGTENAAPKNAFILPAAPIHTSPHCGGHRRKETLGLGSVRGIGVTVSPKPLS